MQENSLQERTGQVSPTAQNPQDITSQALQQPSSNLQQTNDQLLKSPSNIQITVPKSSDNHTAQASQQQAKPIETKSTVFGSNLVIVIGVVLVFSFILLTVTKKRSKGATKQEVKPEEEVKIEVVSTPKASKPTKTKKKTNKRKKRSAKK